MNTIMNFSVLNFFERNTFFIDEITDEEKVNYLVDNSDNKFGDDIVMYYFNFTAYNISFVCDILQKKCKSEQIELNHVTICTNKDLTQISTYRNFIEEYKNKIEQVFEDDEEIAIFLQSGVIVYFYKQDEWHLKKAISYDKASKMLIADLMKEVSNPFETLQ